MSTSLIKQFLAQPPAAAASQEDRTDDAAAAARQDDVFVPRGAEPTSPDAPVNNDVADIPAPLARRDADATALDDGSSAGDGATDELAGTPTDSFEDIEEEINGGDPDCRREAEERAEELAEAVTVLANNDRAVEQLDTVTNGLTDVRDTLVAINERSGGVSAESFQFIEMAANAYTNMLGVESLLLGVSAESFGDADTRCEASVEDIDDLLSRLGSSRASIESALVEERERVNKLLPLLGRRTIQFESRDDEIVLSESPIIDEAVYSESRDDAESAQRREQLEVLVNTRDNIQRVSDILESRNAEGGVSTESIITATLALEAMTRPLGLPEINLVQSFENLDLEAKSVVSTEGLVDALKAIGAGVARVAKSTLQGALNAMGKLSGTVPVTVKRINAVLEKAASATDKGGEIKAGNLPKRLHRDGKWPESLNTYMAQYAPFASKMITKYPVAARSALVANIALALQVDFSSPDTFMTSLTATAKQWKDPRKMAGLTSADMSFDVPGVGPYFDTFEAVEYDGDNDGAKRLTAFVNEHGMRGTSQRGKVKAPELDVVKALSRAEIEGSLKPLLSVLESINFETLKKNSKTATNDWFDAAGKLYTATKVEKAVARKTHPKEWEILNWGLCATWILALDWGVHSANDLVRTARAVIDYADRSLGSKGEASTEDRDPDAPAATPVPSEPTAAEGSGTPSAQPGTPGEPGALETDTGDTTVSAEGVAGAAGGALVSAIPGVSMVAGGAMGHKIQEAGRTIKKLEDQLALKKEHLADLRVHHAAKGSKSVSHEELVASQEGVGGAVGGAMLNLIPGASMITGGAMGHTLEERNKRIKELKDQIKEVEDQIKELNAKVSAEGLEISMEADIKQLKSGKRVKYSHGHGKIVKVYTGPFKYKGETHHASKDTPKFEVKSEKGHHSIHKASALALA